MNSIIRSSRCTSFFLRCDTYTTATTTAAFLYCRSFSSTSSNQHHQTFCGAASRSGSLRPSRTVRTLSTPLLLLSSSSAYRKSILRIQDLNSISFSDPPPPPHHQHHHHRCYSQIHSPPSQSSTQTQTQPQEHDIYLYDRSRYYRNITLGASALLVFVWFPLVYVSISTEALPLWTVSMGPLCCLGMIAACHVRASRMISKIVQRDPNTVILYTHTGLGQTPPATVLPYTQIRHFNSVSSGKASCWSIQIRGREGFYLIDIGGQVFDKAAMRRIVGADKLLM